MERCGGECIEQSVKMGSILKPSFSINVGSVKETARRLGSAYLAISSYVFTQPFMHFLHILRKNYFRIEKIRMPSFLPF